MTNLIMLRALKQEGAGSSRRPGRAREPSGAGSGATAVGGTHFRRAKAPDEPVSSARDSHFRRAGHLFILIVPIDLGARHPRALWRQYLGSRARLSGQLKRLKQRPHPQLSR